MRLFFNTNRHFFRCLFAFIIVISSCKDPDNVGLQVLPPADLSSLGYTDTVSLRTTLVKEDSVLSTGNSASLLGIINDNLFGISNASFYTQALLSNVGVNFGSNPTCDSMILSLAYSGSYGDNASSHDFQVYRVNENISDSLYYSNRAFITSDVLGTYTTSAIHPTDSVWVSGIKTAPHLRIPLDKTKASIFFSPTSSGVYTDNNTFIDYFKGIYVKDVSSPATGGGIIYFNLLDTMSKITLYYNGNLSFTFFLNRSKTVNHFIHDYTNSGIATLFNDPELTKDLSYVQSMAGVRTKVEFPFLDNLAQSGNISVNKAELVITIDNSTTGVYAAHSNLFLAGIDSAGKTFFLPDFISSQTTFGGAQSNGAYSFLITRYVQQILTGARIDYGLFLVASGASANANRTVVGGSSNPNIRMKLKLSYTNINP